MTRVHELLEGRVATLAIPAGEPLRLDARGEIAADDGAVLSFVPMSLSRVALVVRPPVRVLVGARAVAEVMELTHGDHVLHGDQELIYSSDALPAPVETAPGSRCVACCEERTPLLACPRCAALACEACWRGAPGGVCFSAACGQPASLDRSLWMPSPADFLDGEEESP